MAYAADTSVPVDRSKAEIERTLQRYGADQFMSGWDANTVMLAFRMADRQVKFLLPMPVRTDKQFVLTPTGRERTEKQAFAEWEQACRQRWRALNLVIKAKLEAVEAGITEFEDEFAMHIVLPDGTTVGQHVRPAIDQAYATGRMPETMLAIGPAKR